MQKRLTKNGWLSSKSCPAWAVLFVEWGREADWEQNIEAESFKSPEQLRTLYSTIPKNSKIITYCQGGYRAANSFLALKILGYKDVKMYLGSWGEWGNKTELPIERSKK